MAAPGFLCGLGHQESRLQTDLNLVMPRIQVLAHHDPEDSDQPHFRAAMLPGFELVVDLLPLVGTLDRRSVFVDPVPRLTVSGNGRKQARIVVGIRVHAPAVGRVRTRRIARATTLFHEGTAVFASSALGVIPVVFHGALGLKISVERHGVMSRIEEHPFPRPIREIVLELSDAHDERHGVMAGSSTQPRIEGKVIATVRCRDPIEMVSGVIAVAIAVPPDITVGLRIQTGTGARIDSLLSTVTDALATGEGGRSHRCSVSGDRQSGHVPQDPECRRDLHKAFAKQGHETVGWQGGDGRAAEQDPLHQSLHLFGRRRRSFFPLLALDVFLVPFGFDRARQMGADRRPETGEEVVEGTHTGGMSGKDAIHRPTPSRKCTPPATSEGRSGRGRPGRWPRRHGGHTVGSERTRCPRGPPARTSR